MIKGGGSEHSRKEKKITLTKSGWKASSVHPHNTNTSVLLVKIITRNCRVQKYKCCCWLQRTNISWRIGSFYFSHTTLSFEEKNHLGKRDKWTVFLELNFTGWAAATKNTGRFIWHFEHWFLNQTQIWIWENCSWNKVVSHKKARLNANVKHSNNCTDEKKLYSYGSLKLLQKLHY